MDFIHSFRRIWEPTFGGGGVCMKGCNCKGPLKGCNHKFPRGMKLISKSQTNFNSIWFTFYWKFYVIYLISQGHIYLGHPSKSVLRPDLGPILDNSRSRWILMKLNQWQFFKAIPLKPRSISKPIPNEFWLDKVILARVLTIQFWIKCQRKEDFAISSHFFNSPPNCLSDNKKLNLRQLKISVLKHSRFTLSIHIYNGYNGHTRALEKIILDFVLVQSQYMFSRFSLVFCDSGWDILRWGW
jgi:hypothetical protein